METNHVPARDDGSILVTSDHCGRRIRRPCTGSSGLEIPRRSNVGVVQLGLKRVKEKNLEGSLADIARDEMCVATN